MLEAVSLDELGFQSLIVGESEAVATVGQETNLRKKQFKTLNMQNSSRSVKSIHLTESISTKNNLCGIMQRVHES